MNTIIDNLNWRYATKKFDPAKKIPAGDLETLEDAIRLSPSAYGLQPYKVVVVSDDTLKQALRPAINNQAQATDASHLFVFANRIGLDDGDVDHYIGNIAQTRRISADSLSGFSQMMKSKVVPMDDEIKNNWTARQAYIALGQLVTTAAQLRIDITPMEGFNADAVSDVLGLDKIGYRAAVIAAAGYRAAGDAMQELAKVRKPKEELFIHF